MFNADFYPTPLETIQLLTQGLEIEGKVFLEPSAGSGNIIDYLKEQGAKNVLGCENDPRLKVIAASKCLLIADDFLTITSEKISHINGIVMNPPFSKGVEHILHAYEIAPAGCQIRALINYSNYENKYTENRKRLGVIIDNFGSIKDIGNPFTNAERETGVKVGLITLQKPGESYESEFDGFFLDEEQELQSDGIMTYNAVRDIVNRYVEAVKVYDQQIETAVKINDLVGTFYKGQQISVTMKAGETSSNRNEFKKALQKDGWTHIINKFNLQKYATRGLMEDINKFVENQQNIPFTMKNIYHMVDVIIGTTGARMDKAMLEIFDKLTSYHDDNKQGLPGWKTNSHFLLTKKFIFPHIGNVSAKRWGSAYTETTFTLYRHDTPTISDLEKTLCFLTGNNYDEIKSIFDAASRAEYGIWHESHFFKFRGYKKGTLHVEFKNDEYHAKFNQQIARIKGYPLFEGKEQTAYQKRQTGRTTAEKSQESPKNEFKVMFETTL